MLRSALLSLAVLIAGLARGQELVPNYVTVRVGSTVQVAISNGLILSDCGVASAVAQGAVYRIDGEYAFVVRGIKEGIAPVTCRLVWSRYGTIATIGYVEVRPNLLALPCPPEVLVSPQQVEVAFGTRVTMRAVATSAELTSVQWYWGRTGDTRNPVVGAVVPNLDFLPTNAGEFQFWPRISSFCGSTDGATVTIRSEPCLPPAITRQPTDIEVSPGAGADLSIEHTGNEPFTYQWYRGEPGDVSAPIATSNGKSITVTATGARERYWVRVGDSCGYADSRGASVSPSSRSRPITFLRPLIPSNGILWVAAHPDDEILVAPLLTEVCAEGRGRCTILIATRGERGACELPGGCVRSELPAIRTEEALSSATLLGAALSAGDFPMVRPALPMKC